MLLRVKSRRPNGTLSGEYWYVSSVCVEPDGKPGFAVSLNKNRARSFNEETAKHFNDKLMELGMISYPFEIIKG